MRADESYPVNVDAVRGFDTVTSPNTPSTSPTLRASPPRVSLPRTLFRATPFHWT